MAGISHDDLIKALECRYDYLSARSMAGPLLEGAGLGPKDSYDAEELAKLTAAAEAVIGAGADKVIAALASVAAPVAPKPEKQVEAAPKAKKEPEAVAPKAEKEPEAVAPKAEKEPEAAPETDKAAKKGKGKKSKK